MLSNLEFSEAFYPIINKDLPDSCVFESIQATHVFIRLFPLYIEIHQPFLQIFAASSLVKDSLNLLVFFILFKILPINKKIVNMKFSNKHFKLFFNRCSIKITIVIKFLIIVSTEIIRKKNSNIIESGHLETTKKKTSLTNWICFLPFSMSQLLLFFFVFFFSKKKKKKNKKKIKIK